MDSFTQIMNLFRQFKLGQSLFKNNYRLSKDMLDRGSISPDDMKAIAARQAVESLSKYIIDHYKHTIKEVECIDHEVAQFSAKHEAIEFRTELLVLEISNFKTIVEAAIQMLPQSEIDRIKAGGVI